MLMAETQRARIERYSRAYAGDYGYESWLVRGRRAATMRTLMESRPRRVVEVGCALDPLAAHALGLSSAPASMLRAEAHASAAPDRWVPERWVIVEPAGRFAAAARDIAAEDPRVGVVEAFVEQAVSEVERALGAKADLVILDGLLHEVHEPASVLRAARALMAEAGLVHVSVPNARSLHRRVGQAMGILEDPHELSARNKTLEQERVYDLDALELAIRKADLEPVERGGHTIKPFTNAQMAEVEPILGAQVLEGLLALGAALPDLSAEVWVRAKRAS